MAGGKLEGGIIKAAGAYTPGWVSNIGMSLSGGTFKLVGTDGNTFSSTNAGWVTIPSTTGGQLVTLKATSDIHSFIDDAGASQIIGEEFGVTSGRAWGNDRPFYLYACNADNTDANLRFFISPNPTLKVSPATTNIGYQSNPMSSPSDSGAFFLTSTNVTASHNEKPCIRIGGIRMQMSASDDWTVQSLSNSSGDGIRPDPYENTYFTMPTGQMGAQSGSYFNNSGFPTWATAANIVFKYALNLDGHCRVYFLTNDAGACTNGSNGNILVINVPYIGVSIDITTNFYANGIGLCTVANTSQYRAIRFSPASQAAHFSLISTPGNLANNSLSNANDDLEASFFYKAF